MVTLLPNPLAPSKLANTTKKDSIFIVGICSENIINVKDGKAIGFITTDRMKAKQPEKVDLDYAIRLIEKKTKPEKEYALK